MKKNHRFLSDGNGRGRGRDDGVRGRDGHDDGRVSVRVLTLFQNIYQIQTNQR